MNTETKAIQDSLNELNLTDMNLIVHSLMALESKTSDSSDKALIRITINKMHKIRISQMNWLHSEYSN